MLFAPTYTCVNFRIICYLICFIQSLQDGDSSAMELTPLKLSNSDAERNESLLSINQPTAPNEDATLKTARTKLY